MALFAYSPLAEELVRPFYEPRELRSASNLAQRLASLRDSEVQNTDQEFRICVDLGCFKPEEVKITSNDKQVCISARHEEKQDKHGYVSRKMTRVYTLPPDVDPKSVTSTMNNQSVLCIRAAKKVEAAKEVPIAVEYTGS